MPWLALLLGASYPFAIVPAIARQVNALHS